MACGPLLQYDSRNPPESTHVVAAYIARHYRLREGVHGAPLNQVYNESNELAREVLSGKTDLPLPEAIRLVEKARTGRSDVRHIPRACELSRSIVARANPAMDKEPLPLSFDGTLSPSDSAALSALISQIDPSLTSDLDPDFLAHLLQQSFHEAREDIRAAISLLPKPVQIEVNQFLNGMEGTAEFFTDNPHPEHRDFLIGTMLAFSLAPLIPQIRSMVQACGPQLSPNDMLRILTRYNAVQNSLSGTPNSRLVRGLSWLAPLTVVFLLGQFVYPHIFGSDADSFYPKFATDILVFSAFHALTSRPQFHLPFREFLEQNRALCPEDPAQQPVSVPVPEPVAVQQPAEAPEGMNEAALIGLPPEVRALFTEPELYWGRAAWEQTDALGKLIPRLPEMLVQRYATGDSILAAQIQADVGAITAVYREKGAVSLPQANSVRWALKQLIQRLETGASANMPEILGLIGPGGAVRQAYGKLELETLFEDARSAPKTALTGDICVNCDPFPQGQVFFLPLPAVGAAGLLSAVFGTGAEFLSGFTLIEGEMALAGSGAGALLIMGEDSGE